MVFGNTLRSLLGNNNSPILGINNVNLMSTGNQNLSSSHKVDSLEKRFLVWTGKYKSIQEVPEFVGQHVMERARNRMRIKIANYMMAATIVGCIVMVYLGKQDAKKGESVAKQNQEWHRKFNEEQKNK